MCGYVFWREKTSTQIMGMSHVWAKVVLALVALAPTTAWAPTFSRLRFVEYSRKYRGHSQRVLRLASRPANIEPSGNYEPKKKGLLGKLFGGEDDSSKQQYDLYSQNMPQDGSYNSRMNNQGGMGPARRESGRLPKQEQNEKYQALMRSINTGNMIVDRTMGRPSAYGKYDPSSGGPRPNAGYESDSNGNGYSSYDPQLTVSRHNADYVATALERARRPSLAGPTPSYGSNEFQSTLTSSVPSSMEARVNAGTFLPPRASSNSFVSPSEPSRVSGMGGGMTFSGRAANGPAPTLQYDMFNLFVTGLDADVTINCVGTGTSRTFRVHSQILKARSSYMRATLAPDALEVIEPDFDAEVFEEFLKYLYTDTLPPNAIDDMGEALMLASHKYGCGALKELCEERLCRDLTVENAASRLVLADVADGKALMESCLFFIKSRAQAVMQTPGWAEVMAHKNGLLGFPLFQTMAGVTPANLQPGSAIAEQYKAQWQTPRLNSAEYNRRIPETRAANDAAVAEMARLRAEREYQAAQRLADAASAEKRAAEAAYQAERKNMRASRTPNTGRNARALSDTSGYYSSNDEQRDQRRLPRRYAQSEELRNKWNQDSDTIMPSSPWDGNPRHR